MIKGRETTDLLIVKATSKGINVEVHGEDDHCIGTRVKMIARYVFLEIEMPSQAQAMCRS